MCRECAVNYCEVKLCVNGTEDTFRSIVWIFEGFQLGPAFITSVNLLEHSISEPGRLCG